MLTSKPAIFLTLACGMAAATEAPLSFEVNRGQADPNVRFLARGDGISIYLTAAEAVLAVGPSAQIVRMGWMGANPRPQIEGEIPLAGRANYLVGRDPSAWHAGIPTFGRVRYRDVYPGVDAIYHGEQHRIEYDFVVAPAADPGLIRFSLEGARKLELDPNGDLLVHTRAGILRQHKPMGYQERGGRREMVGVRYQLYAHRQVGFKIFQYDRSRELVIDPVVSFATYMGGKVAEIGHGVAVDAKGNSYVVGETTSSDFPTSHPIYSAQAATDVFVAKYSPDGATLLYSTYLGGTAHDVGTAIAVDAAGNAYIAGRTASANFPTVNAAQPAFGGTEDAFAAKLDPTGAKLLYSTYIGGKLIDQGMGIAIDGAGSAYVTGHTVSTDFPAVNAFRATRVGSYDVFVTKLDPVGASFVYSTYLGGVQDDYGKAIAVDPQGNAYVTGITGSPNFPVANALQPKLNPSGDAFVTKLDPTGQSLVYSTYLGGGGLDQGNGITADACGFAYVTGQTQSTNFPTTPGALQPGFSGPASGGFAGDAFVARLDPAGANLLYSTYLGGGKGDWGTAITLDAAGNPYVTGATASADFPVMNAAQAHHGGAPCSMTPCGDAFAAKLSLDGNSLLYSTFFGGGKDEAAMGIAVDGAGSAWLTGLTLSDDLPTMKPLQRARVGAPSSTSADAFMAKIEHPMETAADLAVNMSAAAGAIATGQNLAYTVTVANQGPSTAAAAVLTVTLPAGVNFLEAAPAESCAPAANNTVTCSLGDLANGATAAVQIAVTAMASGPAAAGASVVSSVPDAFQCNNTAAANVAIVDVQP